MNWLVRPHFPPVSRPAGVGQQWYGFGPYGGCRSSRPPQHLLNWEGPEVGLLACEIDRWKEALTTEG